jgi:hypothetical protein
MSGLERIPISPRHVRGRMPKRTKFTSKEISVNFTSHRRATKRSGK